MGEKGEVAKRLSIAKSMKADGIPFMTISKYTGLSVEKMPVFDYR